MTEILKINSNIPNLFLTASSRRDLEREVQMASIEAEDVEFPQIHEEYIYKKSINKDVPDEKDKKADFMSL